jgi:four helix bundle protein
MKIEKFEDIESWKKSRELVKQIYNITHDYEFSKDFSLVDQIRRASVSIIANIAEGFDGGSNKSFINFLNYSYRSASEVQSLLYVSLDQNYISKIKFDKLYEDLKTIKNLIGGLIKYLKSSKNTR